MGISIRYTMLYMDILGISIYDKNIPKPSNVKVELILQPFHADNFLFLRFESKACEIEAAGRAYLIGYRKLNALCTRMLGWFTFGLSFVMFYGACVSFKKVVVVRAALAES